MMGGKAVLLCCSCVSVVELCGVVAGHTCVIAEWGCWLGGWCLQIPAPLQTHLPPPPGWHLITSLVVPLHFVKCWKCMRISASQRHTRGERASERMKISRGHHFTLEMSKNFPSGVEPLRNKPKPQWPVDRRTETYVSVSSSMVGHSPKQQSRVCTSGQFNK